MKISILFVLAVVLILTTAKVEAAEVSLILNTRERSIVYITYSDNLGGKNIRKAPRDEWKDSCTFDVDAIGVEQ